MNKLSKYSFKRICSFVALVCLSGCSRPEIVKRELQSGIDPSLPIVFGRWPLSEDDLTSSVFTMDVEGRNRLIYQEKLSNLTLPALTPVWLSTGNAIAVSRWDKVPLLISKHEVVECPRLFRDYPGTIASYIIDAGEAENTVFLQLLQYAPPLGQVVKANLKTCQVETVTEKWAIPQKPVFAICESAGLSMIEADDDQRTRILKNGQLFSEISGTIQLAFSAGCDHVVGIRPDGIYRHEISGSNAHVGVKIFSKDFSASFDDSITNNGPFVGRLSLSADDRYIVYTFGLSADPQQFNGRARKGIFLVDLVSLSERKLTDDGYDVDWNSR